MINGGDEWGFALYTILFLAVILEYLLEKSGK
jgi:cbb3-type cytochrome oxidase subunit 3